MKTSKETIVKSKTKVVAMPAAKPVKSKKTVSKSSVATEATPASAAKSAPVINTETIAACAYLLWEQAGRPQGRDVEYWLKAEAQFKREKQALTA